MKRSDKRAERDMEKERDKFIACDPRGYAKFVKHGLRFWASVVRPNVDDKRGKKRFRRVYKCRKVK